MIGGAVAITGRGVLSAIGADWASFAEAVQASFTPQASPLPASSPPDPPLCYVVAGFEPEPRAEPLASIVAEAVRAALCDAGLCPDGTLRDDVGLVMNTVLGPSGAIEAYLERLMEKGPRMARPAQFVDTLLSMPASRAGIELGLRGSTAVLGGSSPLELAFDWVRHGRAGAVVAGGADFGSPKCLRYLRELAGRSGAARILVGQGAGFLVLEEAERARTRGARVLGELLGSGAASEPQDVALPWSSDPSGRALEHAMREALADAGLAARDVGTVALAAGDDVSEGAELAALRTVFGRDSAVNVLRPKRALGETLGGSGTLHVAFALASLERGGVALVNDFQMGSAVTSLVVRAAE